MSKAGYPDRMSFKKFWDKYRPAPFGGGAAARRAPHGLALKRAVQRLAAGVFGLVELAPPATDEDAAAAPIDPRMQAHDFVLGKRRIFRTRAPPSREALPNPSTSHKHARSLAHPSPRAAPSAHSFRPHSTCSRRLLLSAGKRQIFLNGTCSRIAQERERKGDPQIPMRSVAAWIEERHRGLEGVRAKMVRALRQRAFKRAFLVLMDRTKRERMMAEQA